MTVQPISAAALAVYISPADLELRGLCCADLTGELTLALTREALRQAGIPQPDCLELEFWPERCGVLVFVHLPPPPARTVWAFPDGGCLLDAAAALHTALPENTLYWWADRFWLVLEGDHPALSEFCDQAENDPCLPVRLREYGIALIHSNALAHLHTYI